MELLNNQKNMKRIIIITTAIVISVLPAFSQVVDNNGNVVDTTAIYGERADSLDAAVFVSSIIFLLITISGLREAILNAIPFDLKLAIGAGIGFFLAFIGLKGAGIIVADPATLVGMGTILSAPALLAVIGILLTLILYIKKVPAAVFLGLVITAILGVIFTLAGFGVFLLFFA